MSKKHRKGEHGKRAQDRADPVPSLDAGDPGGAGPGKGGRLPRKAYERALSDLHVELVKLQQWAQTTGARICIVFEGRDGAGKGGTIKAITERVSPRVFR